MSDPAALKAQLKRLGNQRSALEADIEVRSGRLQAAGVGMDSPLVDAQVRRCGWWLACDNVVGIRLSAMHCAANLGMQAPQASFPTNQPWCPLMPQL